MYLAETTKRKEKEGEKGSAGRGQALLKEQVHGFPGDSSVFPEAAMATIASLGSRVLVCFSL